MIKRVAETLKAELANINTFSILAPIPGFSCWLKGTDVDGLASKMGTPVERFHLGNGAGIELVS